jgi:hypothetical protein
MTAERDPDDAARGTVSTVARTAGRWLRRLLATAFALGYLLVWGGLAGRHYAQGDIVATGVTLVVFVVPMLALVLWRGGQAYAGDLGELAPDVSPSSS